MNPGRTGQLLSLSPVHTEFCEAQVVVEEARSNPNGR